MKNQLKNVSVLIVDDNCISLMTQEHLLKEFGFQVTIANHPEKAMTILSHQKIDCVLTDIEMPDMRGDEMAIRIHHEFPELPVFAITSTQLSKVKINNEAKFYAILQKPLTPEKINKSFSLLDNCKSDAQKMKGSKNIKVIDTPYGKRVILGSSFPGIYLTMREAELVQLIAEYKYHEIAKIIKISGRTVEYYCINIRKKFRCQSKKELISLLKSSKIIDELKEVIGIRHLLDDKNNFLD